MGNEEDTADDRTSVLVAEEDNTADDRTSVLVTLHHASFRETMLPPVTWHMHPDDASTCDDLKRWVQWEIWQKHYVWIELTQMWSNLVSRNSTGGFDIVRKIPYNEQLLELLKQTDQPVIEVHRSMYLDGNYGNSSVD